VTAPHKEAVARAVGSELESVNTLVVRAGRLEAFSTDTAILADLDVSAPVIVGGGGAAAAWKAALPEATLYSRRGDWPPDTAAADLVVHATSERNEIVCAAGEGQTLIDLPYPETATGRAAREAGARVISGVEVLVAQGAAAFELWTGVPAPVGVMRAAVGLSA